MLVDLSNMSSMARRDFMCRWAIPKKWRRRWRNCWLIQRADEPLVILRAGSHCRPLILLDWPRRWQSFTSRFSGQSISIVEGSEDSLFLVQKNMLSGGNSGERYQNSII